MEESLYNTLGVDKNATTEQIKSAYRDKVKEEHPDKHPGEEEKYTKKFQELALAYNVLADEKKRKRYDETGQTQEQSLQVKFMTYVSNNISSLLNTDVDVDYFDVVSALKEVTRGNIKTCEDNIKKMEKVLKKAKSISKRTRRKNEGDNVIKKISDDTIANIERAINTNKDEIQTFKDFMDLFEAYEYLVEERPVPTNPLGNNFSFTNLNQW